MSRPTHIVAPPTAALASHTAVDYNRSAHMFYDIDNLSVDSLYCDSISLAPSAYSGEQPNQTYPGSGPPIEESPPAPKRSRAKIILTVVSLCLAVAVAALDVTIVTTALPTIVSSFGSEAGYTWIGSSFILAHTVSTLIWGAVSDIFGRKPIILIAVIIFFAGSLVCAVVRQIDLFILGRAVQGVGAAGMQTMVYIIICDLFSLRDRGLYLAIISLIWAVASALGPVLGGVFASRLNWRWCFWINLPVSGIVFMVLFVFLNVTTAQTPILSGLKSIDWTGSILIICSTLMVLLGLDFGGTTYPWASPTVICLILFGCIVAACFILNEWKVAQNPILPLRLFSPSSLAAYGVRFCHAYVFMGIAYYIPLYSQSVLGANALTSGIYLLPFIVSLSLSAAGTGIFIQKTGRYLPLMQVGIVIMLLGIGLFIDLSFRKDLAKLFIFQILGGIGVGMNSEGPVLAAQATAPVKDTAAIAAAMAFTRSISTVISIVIGGVVFRNEMAGQNVKLVKELGSQLASKFSGQSATINVNDIGTLPDAQQLIVRQAYFGSLRTVWIMYVACAGVAMLLVFLIRPHQLSKDREDPVLGVNSRESIHGIVLEGQTRYMDVSSNETLQGLIESRRAEPFRKAVYRT
ncbi:MFS general substrate transporter [Hypoxylon sp. NC1633]|nr:MFS general substrate transporter [Hypoxylon sp. NC1633]